MSMLIDDLKHSLRILLKSPWVSLTVVVSLGLGIGVNTAIFTILNAILLDPMPVEDVESLVSVYTVDQRFVDGPRGSHHPTSFANFEDLRDHSPAFEHLSAYVAIPLAMELGETPEEVTGQAVTAGFFDMLGMGAAAGRFFLPEENGPRRAQPVVVLSHRLWQSHFAASGRAVGRRVTLNGQPYEIVGVAPQGFNGPDLARPPDLWVPMMMRQQLFSGPLRLYHQERRALMFGLLGRLPHGVTLEQAIASTKIVAQQLATQYPDANRDRTVTVVPLLESTFRPDQRQLFVRAGGVLMLMVGAVLLLVCANVGHLLMVRAERRRPEMSLRLALGSSFGGLARQLLLESLVLAMAGSIVGLLLAYWGRDVLWSLRPPILLNAQPDLGFDGKVLGWTLLVALVMALLASLGPWLRLAQIPLSTVLRDARPIPGSGRLWTIRGALVMSQVALSLGTLIVSALFIVSLDRARRVEAGFAEDELGVVAYNLGTLGYEPQRGADLHRRVVEVAAGLPQVKSAALATVRPFNQRFSGFLRTVTVEGVDALDPENGRLVTTNFVSHDYFTSFDIALRSGRNFRAGDDAEAHRVAIINETMASTLWPGDDPLGRRLQVRGIALPCEVIGVVRDAKYNAVGEAPLPFLYLPLEQSYSESVHLFVRTHGSPGEVLDGLLRKLRLLEPALPWTHVATMEQEKIASLWALRLAASLLTLFAAVATLIAAVGIFGVMSYGMRLRRQELGVRMALGAERSRLVSLLVRQGMNLVLCGILGGWLGTALFVRVLSNLLFGVSGFDAKIFAGMAILLLFIALLANLSAVLRAVNLQPLRALRSE